MANFLGGGVAFLNRQSIIQVMNTNEIIAAIDAEIQRLQEAKALLDGSPSSKPGTNLGSTPSFRLNPVKGS
jgi:hypothetical protein